MVEKRCRICGETKPLNAFYRATGTRDGHRTAGRECNRGARAARSRTSPQVGEPARARTRRWTEENRERYETRIREYRKTPAWKRVQRKTHLKRMYGMTPDDYDRMLEEQ